eukprot:TRINITY_DN656_c0_g1_i21.p2 TRINITY_DN656_c0_g1~~TRINITY_DN656_c0_g1_i21.p2  ORF type:complete len:156 (-),score=36.66 TRINITY_DN656_c0_g1_i21:104-571(-)
MIDRRLDEFYETPRFLTSVSSLQLTWPMSVEMHTRFLQTSADPDAFAKAIEVYRIGLQRHPQSAYVHLQYALMLLAHDSKGHFDAAQQSVVAVRQAQMAMWPDVQFLHFYLTKIVDQINETQKRGFFVFVFAAVGGLPVRRTAGHTRSQARAEWA